ASDVGDVLTELRCVSDGPEHALAAASGTRPQVVKISGAFRQDQADSGNVHNGLVPLGFAHNGGTPLERTD
ncbi:MAG: hypothetical protein M3179_14465, partial [Actinomycetota bacterium]|nr:hypothetical protein [Actinomycetota bacterium]